ncbi:coenzyme-B sulfoethylthiotransferase subunit gamma, partial [Methanocorpusculum sp.]
MAYKPQYGPGTSKVAEVRRNQMNPNVKLEKIRSVTDEDIVLIMGHRAPGQAYPSAHPPLAEQGEPDCPIRKI